jgi:hypothetical protein
MDEYAEAVARYPNAKFAYMGHSNGTYMLARSLEDYPVVRFTYVVFAGSVVPTDYNWAMYIAQGRIDGVLNYTASADEVVAFFPKLFQRPRWQDLGSAGHDGFDQAATEPDVYQLGPIAGGHSAARQEPEWDAIARFLLDGGDVTASNLAPRRNRLVAALGAVPILVWLFIVVLLLGGGWLVLQIPSETVRVLAAVGYVWFVWKVLTRV